MRHFEIISSNTTPHVTFDAKTNYLSLRGSCRPEDSIKFFKPIRDWLVEYAVHVNNKSLHTRVDIILTIDLDYMNSSSTMFVFGIINKLNGLTKNPSVKLTIYWHFDQEDEDSENLGEEISEQLNLEFNFVKGGSV